MLAGERIPIRFIAPGILMLGPAGDDERIRYQISDDRLTVVSEDEISTWKRVPRAVAAAEDSGDDKAVVVTLETPFGPVRAAATY